MTSGTTTEHAATDPEDPAGAPPERRGNEMERRRLGGSGLEVSVFSMGTMTFGDEADEAESHAMLDRFVEVGGTLIDTADVYAQGRSEQIIGRWLASRSDIDHLVIATKAFFAAGDHPTDRGAGRRHLTRALDASLRRLGVEVIDLYQIHCWDSSSPLEETLATLHDMVGAGKVRYVGVSNVTGWQLQRYLLTARHMGAPPIVSYQAQYNLLDRHIEWELLPQCVEEGIGLLPWSPLGGGWLAGKYSPDKFPAGATRLGENPQRGVEAYAIRNNERTWRILDEVGDIASARGVGHAQVALNWLRRRPSVASVILGARTVEQLDENLAALEWRLTPEEGKRLDEVAAPGLPDYPYGFIEDAAPYRLWELLGTRAGQSPLVV
jgi:aryl-alcohol dehydrogenase-like predicted oxidoreductase